MNKYLLGIDIGTTSVKTIICNVNNYKIVADAKATHDLFSLHPGWAEENPIDWWNNVISTIRSCMKKTNIDPKEIVGIGVSGMVPAFLLLDSEGKVLRPSMQQNDARTYKEIEYIRKKIKDNDFFHITGCIINQQMVGPKILWMKKNEPDIFKKVEKIMGSYDYIVYKLTGEYSLEHNWALESGLYDIHNGKWSDKILKIIGIDKDFFPRVNKPTDIVGKVNKEVSKLLNLKEGIPVVAGSADHIASAFMAGIQNEGDLLLKFGGAGDILCSTDKLVTDKRLFIDYHIIPNKFLINGCMASSGSALKWFTKQSFKEDDINYEEIDKKSHELRSGSEGIVILPYFIGEKTPIFDPLARGVIFGLSLHHTKYHIYRALLEGIGYGFLHHIEVLKELGFEPKNVIATNGGAISRIWGKIISNIIGYPITYLKENPGSSLGAAFIAGMGTNCYKDWFEAKNFIKVSHTIYHDEKEHAKYQKYFEIYKKLYLSLKDLYKDLDRATKI